MNLKHKAQNIPNTLAISTQANKLLIIDNLLQLKEVCTYYSDEIKSGHFYILGEGSNTLFLENEVEMVISPYFKGIEIKEDNEFFYVTAGASENWHQLVSFLINEEVYGLENLALIPGSVGAAPVQNIGAYGVELSKFCQQVDWFDFATQTVERLSNQACQFGYRDSIFKNSLKNKGIILAVHFSLPKNWQPVCDYQGLNSLPVPVNAQAIFHQVVAIRESKLPDPNELPNAGSFFKNPIVNKTQFRALQKTYPDMPYYPQTSEMVKLAAGWLIEQAGLKGKQLGKVAVHQAQALVLVNNQHGNGQDIIKLARLIKQQVFEKFNVVLEPEVRFVGRLGECDAKAELDREN